MIRFLLKVNKKSILGWSIAIFLVMFLYMILFPSVKDMAEIKMNAMPKEVMQFMGMSDFSGLNNFTTYFGIVFNLVLIAISIFAVTFSSSIIIKDEKNKSIEFLYSLEVSRTNIYLSKLATSAIAIFIVMASGFLSTFVCGAINGGDTFSVSDIFAIMKIVMLVPYIYMAIGICLSSISSKFGTPALGSMVVLFTYFIGYLGTLLGDKGSFLKPISPFESFQAAKALSPSYSTITWFWIYFLLTALLCIIGLISYRRRDFNV